SDSLPIVCGEKISHLGHYKLLKYIGHGGYGTIYLSRSRRPWMYSKGNELCAIKFQLEPEAGNNNISDRTNMLENEIRLLKKAQSHQNIVAFHDYGRIKSHTYLVMEYCNGPTLCSFIDLLGKEKVYCSDTNIRDIFGQILDGVEHIHSKKIIHCDLTPKNILLTENNTVKIIDFGLAIDEQFKSRCGTARYMAPERFGDGELFRPTTDIWSLGVILMDMIS
ncbi:kinase-like domain-containing protein, partial [Cyathus striatus]